jgi:hypothetical protein
MESNNDNGNLILYLHAGFSNQGPITELVFIIIIIIIITDETVR